jgi:NADPH-dependent F420 reductase
MQSYVIGVLGGTGPQGKGLAARFALAGHDVVLGSRTHDRAAAAAAELNGQLGAAGQLSAASNAAAAERCEVAIIAVPYDPRAEAISELAPALAGKVAVSCLNPLAFDAQGAYGMEVPHGSAAEHLAAVLPATTLVGGFHHVSARNLLPTATGSGASDEDVLVCGDDLEAKQLVMGLAAAVGGRVGIDAGPLRMARYLEPFTAVLIAVNKRYKTHAGVAVTGIPELLSVGAAG